MRWDIIGRGVVRYTLPWGVGVGIIGYVMGDLFAMLVLVIGVLSLAFTFTGTSGTGTAAHAIEPASGVNISPRDYATKPIGAKNVRIFFWSVGLILGAVTGLVVI